MKDVRIKDDLCNFIERFGDDLCSLELLLFFARHPNARFNRTAVVNSVTSNQFDTAISLKRLIDQKVISTRSENGIPLYSLNKEEPTYYLVAQMVSIGQDQWQIILERILDAQGIK